jgi:stage III sporulation protein SpoIIIAA
MKALDKHVHIAEKLENRSIILSMLTLCVVIGLAKLGLKQSKREKMGGGKPIKRKICGFTMLLTILIGFTLNTKLRMIRHVARSVEIGKELNDQKNIQVVEEPQEARW